MLNLCFAKDPVKYESGFEYSSTVTSYLSRYVSIYLVTKVTCRYQNRLSQRQEQPEKTQNHCGVVDMKKASLRKNRKTGETVCWENVKPALVKPALVKPALVSKNDVETTTIMMILRYECDVIIKTNNKVHNKVHYINGRNK